MSIINNQSANEGNVYFIKKECEYIKINQHYIVKDKKIKFITSETFINILNETKIRLTELQIKRVVIKLLLFAQELEYRFHLLHGDL